ncbi:uncharacterized protein N7496_006707 [Penicillium cataractarum]|uniref:Uncharacterized protein n=1 Tax=Penicillium cataractarum TaxID=2100454 RepID=A0A9W9V8S6_9EURO|nr:uncharacterized protein N7496_006707 [Penicillium cataractarum]KAJ5370615.1 hypothetical protein N7496_006707 [Penicillium cataractarum]
MEPEQQPGSGGSRRSGAVSTTCRSRTPPPATPNPSSLMEISYAFDSSHDHSLTSPRWTARFPACSLVRGQFSSTTSLDNDRDVSGDIDSEAETDTGSFHGILPSTRCHEGRGWSPCHPQSQHFAIYEDPSGQPTPQALTPILYSDSDEEKENSYGSSESDEEEANADSTSSSDEE